MRGRLSLSILAFGVFLVSLLWGALALKVRAEREAEIKSAMTHTANLARAVEEHTVRTLREADQVLLFLKHQYAMQGTKPNLRQLIEDVPIVSRIYTLLSIIDENGDLVAASGPFTPMNFSDREHFRVHAERDILGQPFISEPVLGRVSGKLSIELTRRIEKPDRSFGGAAVVSIDTQYFSQFYSDLDIGKHGRATLIGRDGVIRAQRIESRASAPADSGELRRIVEKISPGSSDSRHMKSPLDGVVRIFSYRALVDYPLVVVVAAAEDEALADFNRRKREYYVGAAVVSVVVLTLTLLLAALASRQRRLAQQMGLVADNVPAMIAYYDADLRCLFANRSYCDFRGIAPRRIIGMKLADITGEPLYREISPGIALLKDGESVTMQQVQRAATGESRNIEVHQVPDLSAEREFRGYYVMLLDITERERAEERINHLTQHDLLTALPNRVLFRDRLVLAHKRAKRRGETLGVMLLNLDRFKQVNESLGHEAGDELLRQVGARLRECLRDEDTVGRLGSDEFAILIEGTTGHADVAAVLEKITAALATPFQVRGNETFSSPSIGVALYPNGGGDAHSLLDHAEIAMRRVKREGGNAHEYYAAQPGPERGRRIAIESRLRRALENREFTLHYQPKVSLESESITGVEALLRWSNPNLGAVSPAQFIPIAEETGLIVPIGEWVLRTACLQAVEWERDGVCLTMAVNLSPRQFRQANLTAVVAALLTETGLQPERLELEVTESTAMTHPEHAISVLAELRRLGVRLAVDDFGTGYSSLNYLKRFPLHRLKIDRSFVMDIGTDSHDDAIVNATIALAHNMRLKITAEGVETKVQRDFLARAGCDDYQGYYFSRPLPASELLTLVRSATMTAHA